ncbi:cell adhesion molecule CEACAM2-like [Rhinoraja longicauda]
MFLGMGEEVMNTTKVLNWEKVDVRSGNLTSTEYVLQFHVSATKPSLIQKYMGRIHFIPLNGSLVFSNLTSADTGLYRLSINLRTRIIRHVRLWIMERLSNPSIRSNGSSPGATIQLECTVVGDARRYWWQKDGVDIPHHHLAEGNRSLVLLDVTRKNCGIYTCIVSNPVSYVQADYTLTIYGLQQMDIVVIVASIVGIIFPTTSFIGLLVLCISRKKLVQAPLRQHKRWVLLLVASNTISLVAIFIALIFWMVIRGPASVTVVASCTAFVLLLFNLSLTITVWKLGCHCIARLLDCTGKEEAAHGVECRSRTAGPFP